MALADKSKSELASALSRARSAMQNVKAESKAIAGRTINVALAAGTGYGVGVARKKFGEGPQKKVFVPGTQVEADLAIGVLLAAGAVMGVGDEYADSLVAISGATLASNLAIAQVLGD